jgi:hypothetical protein
MVCEAPDYIRASSVEIDLPDLTPEKQESAVRQLEFEGLVRGLHYPITFRVEGMMFGYNRLLMVMLVCKMEDRDEQNVLFVINTASIHIYLSAGTMEAHTGKPRSELFTGFLIEIHHRVMWGNLSPSDKKYANMNVLGADFLWENNLILDFASVWCFISRILCKHPSIPHLFEKPMSRSYSSIDLF